MEDYKVQLDVYHGPLDLLLYLIKRDEIDIHDIPIARVTEQYLQYVATLKQLDINLAGEFLVVAATLMEVKSALMAHEQGLADAPEGETVEAALTDGAPGADPRFELVQQLLAYKRFKDAAALLDTRRIDFAGRFPRHPARLTDEPIDENAMPDIDMEDVSVWNLMEAFARLMEQVGGPSRIDLVSDDTPIQLHSADIADRLQREGPMTLQQMFAGRKLQEMIGLFIATLELIRQRRVKITQEDLGDIHMELRPESEWDDLKDETGKAKKVQYDPHVPGNFDWPDADTQKRYTRRIERRLRGEKIEEDEELEADIAALEAAENAPAITALANPAPAADEPPAEPDAPTA
jgi:segregation and condensation protein A